MLQIILKKEVMSDFRQRIQMFRACVGNLADFCCQPPQLQLQEQGRGRKRFHSLRIVQSPNASLAAIAPSCDVTLAAEKAWSYLPVFTDMAFGPYGGGGRLPTPGLEQGFWIFLMGKPWKTTIAKYDSFFRNYCCKSYIQQQLYNLSRKLYLLTPPHKEPRIPQISGSM